jgi:hypothetical protein
MTHSLIVSRTSIYPVATVSKSFSRYTSLLRYLILCSSGLSRPLRQRHASSYSAYCKRQREPNETLATRLVTVSGPSQIASQGRSLQRNGRAKPLTGLAARRGMERAGRTGRTISAPTLWCACLHHQLTRLAGCTQRAPHRHSRQATRFCLVRLSSSCCRMHCRRYRGPTPSSIQ